MPPLTRPFPQSKARKLRSKGRGKADLLKKSLEDKIRLFEERAPEDLADKVGLSAAVYSTQSLRGRDYPLPPKPQAMECPVLQMGLIPRKCSDSLLRKPPSSSSLHRDLHHPSASSLVNVP